MNPTTLQIIGAILTMIVGLNGLFRPASMGKAVGLKHENLVGLIELRVLFGSFLVALPLCALLLQQRDFLLFYGVSALAGAIIKMLFTVIDKCAWKQMSIGILVDVVLAFCLLSPLIFN